MKKRLKEMEEEAAALREMQAKVKKEMSTVQEFLDSPISPESDRHPVIIRSVQSDLLNGWRHVWFFSA
nr:polyadenylate-binding protein 3 [Quercus suber]